MSTDKVTPMPPKPLTLGERKKYYIDWQNPPKEGDHHPEIDVYVSLQDTVHWYCDKKFRVRSVKPASENPDAPYPFYRRFPEDQPEFAFQVNSGPVRPEAGYEYLYKPVFTFEDKEIKDFDPHIRTHQAPGGGR
jgi:hypothetical protein